MANLDEFKSRLEARITAIQNEPQWTPAESRKFMAGIEQKRKQFQVVAEHLISSLIRPRLRFVAERFHGVVVSNDPPEHCSCWFPSSASFPVLAKVGFAVEHDPRFDNIIVGYEMYMMPVFVKYKDKDRLTLSRDAVPDDKVAVWTEQRLLDFVESYLQIDRGVPESNKIATDPVCGMRISITDETLNDNYYGHTYFFCSHECLQQFEHNPKQYVSIKTM